MTKCKCNVYGTQNTSTFPHSCVLTQQKQAWMKRKYWMTDWTKWTKLNFLETTDWLVCMPSVCLFALPTMSVSTGEMRTVRFWKVCGCNNTWSPSNVWITHNRRNPGPPCTWNSILNATFIESCWNMYTSVILYCSGISPLSLLAQTLIVAIFKGCLLQSSWGGTGNEKWLLANLDAFTFVICFFFCNVLLMYIVPCNLNQN